MPVYTFRCPVCRKAEDRTLRISERDAPQSCACAALMVRQQIYPLALGGVDFRSYVSPASGRLIDSPTAEREELARTGCFIDEPGVKAEIRSRRAAIEEESGALAGELIAKTYGELETSGKV